MGPDGESCSMPYAPVSALQRPQEPCTGATVRPGQRQPRGLSPNCSCPANPRPPSPRTSATSTRAHHTPPWARRSRPRSHPRRHTSSVPECSGRSPCSGIHRPRRSSGLQDVGTGEESLLGEPRGGTCARWGNGVTGAAGERGCQGRWATHCSWLVRHCRPHSHCPCHRPRRGGCSAW